MSNGFDLQPLWQDSDFIVQKGILNGQTTLAGDELGEGIILVPERRTLIQRLSGAAIAEEPVLGVAGTPGQPLWNEGRFTEFVNPSDQPLDVICVQMNTHTLDPSIADSMAMTTADFLHGEWSDEFKTSVRLDLDAIGQIGAALAAGASPSPQELQQARWAKEDIEFKLIWLANEPPVHSPFGFLPDALASSIFDLVGTRFALPMNITLPSAKKSPSTGMISVKVNTQNSAGGREDYWRVYANPHALGSGKTAFTTTFSQLSSPTTESLAVGMYWMWADKTPSVNAAIAVTVGRSSVSPQKVDLIVP